MDGTEQVSQRMSAGTPHRALASGRRGHSSRPFHRDCCQYCCRAAGQHRSRVDSCGMSTPAHVQQWTILNDAPIPTDLCSYASCVLVER